MKCTDVHDDSCDPQLPDAVVEIPPVLISHIDAIHIGRHKKAEHSEVVDAALQLFYGCGNILKWKLWYASKSIRIRLHKPFVDKVVAASNKRTAYLQVCVREHAYASGGH